MRVRTFIPKSQYVGKTNIRTCVRNWIWTKHGGLRVRYTNGMGFKSEYTLPELLKSGEAIEVEPIYLGIEVKP